MRPIITELFTLPITRPIITDLLLMFQEDEEPDLWEEKFKTHSDKKPNGKYKASTYIMPVCKLQVFKYVYMYYERTPF